MDRRTFLRWLAVSGGVVAALPVRASVSAPERPRTRVALVRTSDRAAGVRRAIDLLGIAPARGERVLIKPNFNSADEAPGSTHIDTLRALLLALQDQGARDITLADRSGQGVTRSVMERKGIFSLARETGAGAVVYDELDERAWATVQARDQHWAGGFAVPKMLLDAPCVVQTCNLKTHRYGGHFTLSLKNSVGLVAKQTRPSGHNYMSELHGSPYQRHMIAEINTSYAPALIVLDGVEAFTTGGPDRGNIVAARVMVAGTDRVAVDAVGVAILRLLGTTPEVARGKIFGQDQIARAVELGVDAVRRPGHIKLVTGDAPSAAFARRVRGMLDAG